MAITFALLQRQGRGGQDDLSPPGRHAGPAGPRVLLLDADPQASLTQGFWGPEAMRLPEESSVAALFDPDSEPIPAASSGRADWRASTSCPAPSA